MKKNNLDEMQEQQLRGIEKNSFWLTYVLLIAAIVIQAIALPFNPTAFLGECLVLMISCLYLAISCMRAGIWDRRLKIDFKTNLLVSLVTGLFFGAVVFAVSFRNFGTAKGAAATGLIGGAAVFILCLITLQLAASATRKKQAELEKEDED